ncbi:superinfection exclusion B family protein [Sunxiuqinia indica]|uniref:superinfection exclusion B family protein n=1 Tax=Sunxiuqinia indica TaxID=2692584 RepID=UPI0013568C92|nr:superinfection exclusion B family protein [Sunxiuqinia indica]
MEKFLLKLFDINKIPTKLIFVLWLSSSLILFVPERFLTRLNLTDFLVEYGKYIGITFIVTSGFLIVVLISYISRLINSKTFSRKIKRKILNEIQNLNFHEKALLREFYINGKNTLQLPIDDDTVTGLTNKHILYQASNTGFTYIHGAYFPYSITEIASKNLTHEMINLPKNLTEEDEQFLIENRPEWAKQKSKMDNLFNSVY